MKILKRLRLAWNAFWLESLFAKLERKLKKIEEATDPEANVGANEDIIGRQNANLYKAKLHACEAMEEIGVKVDYPYEKLYEMNEQWNEDEQRYEGSHCNTIHHGPCGIVGECPLTDMRYSDFPLEKWQINDMIDMMAYSMDHNLSIGNKKTMQDNLKKLLLWLEENEGVLNFEKEEYEGHELY